jgi:dienelactone hydrolase
MLAYVYLPKTGEPPYQAVLLYLGGATDLYDSVDQYPHMEQRVAVYTRSGRAVVFPVYRGQLSRQDNGGLAASVLDSAIGEFREFSATLDYLETRDDIDSSRLGYYGESRGAKRAPILLTLDTRIKAAIIVGAGFGRDDLLHHTKNPEFSLLNYLPRFKVPVVMIGGSLDPIFPLETNQKPFFRLIGTPEADKRLTVLETVHIPPLRADYIREQLDWLDKYLGPVR